MKITPELTEQVAETVYARIDRQPNFAALTEDQRKDFTAEVYSWMLKFRQGKDLEAVVTDEVAGATWDVTEWLMERSWTALRAVTIDPLDDEMMKRVRAKFSPPTPVNRNGEEQLQAGVSESEEATGGPAGGRKGRDRS